MSILTIVQISPSSIDRSARRLLTAQLIEGGHPHISRSVFTVFDSICIQCVGVTSRSGLVMCCDSMIQVVYLITQPSLQLLTTSETLVLCSSILIS